MMRSTADETRALGGCVDASVGAHTSDATLAAGSGVNAPVFFRAAAIPLCVLRGGTSRTSCVAFVARLLLGSAAAAAMALGVTLAVDGAVDGAAGGSMSSRPWTRRSRAPLACRGASARTRENAAPGRRHTALARNRRRRWSL